jgi:hypothetical protein
MNDFDFLFGDWNVINRRQDKALSGSTNFDEFPGIGRCRPIFGGAGNVDEIDFPTLGYRGVTLRLFDPVSGDWSLYWASSRTGRLEPPVVGRFTDGVGTFVGDDEYEGRPIKVRYIWSEITDSSARWQQELSADGGTTWELNWVMNCTRA